MISKLTDRHKLMAYVLNKEFNYSQKDIAQLMKVSQPTIANAVKEATYQLQINHLKQLYLEVKENLQRNGYKALPRLSESNLLEE